MLFLSSFVYSMKGNNPTDRTNKKRKEDSDFATYVKNQK